VIHPPERALPDPQTHVLALQRAGQSRLDHASARGQKRMEVHVRGLGAELARLEEDLSDMSEPSPVWREREDLLHSVPGMGPGMSRLVLAELPEWGRLHRKQVAALGGWPPSIATAAGCEAGGPSGADEPRGARRSLGRRGGRRAGIPSSGRATSVCVPPATHRTGASC
jgi:transposase